MMSNKLFKIITISVLAIAGFGTGLIQTVNGQEIGDKLPDLKIKGPFIMGNEKSTVADLYQKGGLIINFWATWCSPCLKEQKRLDSLTQIYPDLSVLSVTYEDISGVKAHFARAGLPKSKSMIITTNDTIFHNAFKHRAIPHNIWIDKAGIIKASTGGDEINEKNIKEFLKGNTSKLHIKKDRLDFSFTKTYHVPDSMILFRSYITGYNEEITSGVNFGPDENGEFKRLFAWNRPIIQFFWLAFTKQKNSRMNWKLIELDSSDSIRFIQTYFNRPLFERSKYTNGDDLVTRERKWDYDNLYCYELILPKNIPASKSSEYMLPDLEKFFNIKASTRKKKMMTNVVSLDKSKLSKLPVAKGEKPFIDKFYDSLIVKSTSIDDILDCLMERFTDDTPYVNKTGYNGLLSFEIKSEKGKLTLEEVWAKLNGFGIKKVEKKHLYEILVLKDLSHPNKI
ncbi:thiol-disulfide isomerase/thioredoxin [Pedobacter cryoconitis]|uniref:Thiol-disulfide isomerase/thioredoxin n=1 Tax=Pedobacter cryoconitis TaxID=188932 RepID=A0A7W8ZNG1_9SPHI|nr:TlpA disulfide reductase family protein [Pedobacter cryoconitis]MBB5637261.1 thiol-disulfide isomerase/thioredoxin [Pedobacter cryoconitis]